MHDGIMVNFKLANFMFHTYIENSLALVSSNGNAGELMLIFFSQGVTYLLVVMFFCVLFL